MRFQQKIAAAAAPVLVLSMIAVYRISSRTLDHQFVWYAGFLLYWLLWCVLFPLLLLGRGRVISLFASARMSTAAWILVAVPPAVSLIGRWFGFRQGSTNELPWITLALINGVLEEVLWRGVYSDLFRGNVFWGIIWPSVWFGLWHLAPASVHTAANAEWQLAFAAALLGLAFGWVAHSSGSVRWTAASHILAGLLQT